jgi:hypothetical protein
MDPGVLAMELAGYAEEAAGLFFEKYFPEITG